MPVTHAILCNTLRAFSHKTAPQSGQVTAALHLKRIEKMKYFRGVCIAVIFSYLNGCGGNSSGSSFQEDLIGSWLLECDESTSQLYEISEIEMLVESTEFENEDCSGDVISSSSTSAIYSIGEPVSLSGGDTAYEVDLTVTIDGESIEILEILFIDGERLYSGVETEDDSRPTEIDFLSYMVKM